MIEQKKSRLNEFDQAVAGRLLEFRSFRKIPRSSFAASIGIGTERLAAYEAARNPLKYFVFRKISHLYGLNPFYLAGKLGWGHIAAMPFDDEAFISKIPPNASFQAVFKDYIQPTKMAEWIETIDELEGELELFYRRLNRGQWTGKVNEKDARARIQALRTLIAKLSHDLPPSKPDNSSA